MSDVIVQNVMNGEEMPGESKDFEDILDLGFEIITDANDKVIAFVRSGTNEPTYDPVFNREQRIDWELTWNKLRWSSIPLDPSKIRPLKKQVLVRRLDVAEKTVGGIHIPRTYNEKNLFCEVMKIGPGFCTDDGRHVPATTAKVGDIVLVRQTEGLSLSTWLHNYVLVDAIHVDGIQSPTVETKTGNDALESEAILSNRP